MPFLYMFFGIGFFALGVQELFSSDDEGEGEPVSGVRVCRCKKHVACVRCGANVGHRWENRIQEHVNGGEEASS